MYNRAEETLCRAVGSWSTVAQLIGKRTGCYAETDWIDLNSSSIGYKILPGQCQAFLTSSESFVWFVEQWDVVDIVDANSGLTSVNFTNKKIYPAKVRGLNLPLFNFSGINENTNPNLSVTVRWREGLIRHGNYYSQYEDVNIPCYRPGFGQQILGDLSRPLKSVTVQCRNLGLSQGQVFQAGSAFNGPLGRLMSIASYVNPELAAKYEAAKVKENQKSLNSQDYEQVSTFPVYDTWIDNSGY
jgi:hypothetical protein